MNVNLLHILIVDDDKNFVEKMSNALQGFGEINHAHSEAEFNKLFKPYKYDLILLDIRLKEGKEGLSLLDHIIEEDPSSIVIVVSGYGDISTAVDALQKGAKTFLEKDKFSPDDVIASINHALKDSLAERRIRQLERSLESDEIIGDDSKIKNIRDLIRLVAQDGETTVFIRGETGSGKELVARAIHRIGIRKDGPFVSVALNDTNKETISSELFGHERGAYTGSTGRHHGFFEQAHKGILFLDEIGDLPLDIQVKLLRVLDNKSFRRMGGYEDISVDVQLVTATHKPLEEMIKNGTFREDLYYRLKVFEIFLPPLRARPSDIPLLAHYFLDNLHKKGRTTAKAFAEDSLDLLLSYHWPGNVRELKSVIESAALRSRLELSDKITRKHVAQLLIPDAKTNYPVELDVAKRLAEAELKLIEDALNITGGKKTEAGILLKYPHRFTLSRRVKKILSDFPDMAEQFPFIRNSFQFE